MEQDDPQKKRKRNESSGVETEPWYLSDDVNPLGPIGVPAKQNAELDSPLVIGNPELNPSTYETLPSNSIDYERWSKIFYKLSNSIMELVYGKAGQEYRQAKKSLKEPYTKIATIATNIYADLHGRLALEINRDIICNGTLIPVEDQQNLLQVSTKKAKQTIEMDKRNALKQQQDMDSSYAKALSAWQLTRELSAENDEEYINSLDKNRPQVPPQNPIINMEKEELTAEINKRIPLELRKNYYINVSDAVIEFRSVLERIMNIYDSILPPNEERSTYKDINDEEHKLLLLEYLLISITLDTQVDIPDLLTSDDALQKAINSKLCAFYDSFEKHPLLNESVEPIVGHPTTTDESGKKVRYAVGLAGTKPAVRLFPRYVVPDMPSSGVLTDIIGPDGNVIKTVDGYVANIKLKKIGEEGAVRDDINGYQIDVENTPDIFAASTNPVGTQPASQSPASLWSMLFGNTKGGIKTRKQQKKNKKHTIRKQRKNGTHKKRHNVKNKTSSKK